MFSGQSPHARAADSLAEEHNLVVVVLDQVALDFLAVDTGTQNYSRFPRTAQNCGCKNLESAAIKPFSLFMRIIV